MIYGKQVHAGVGGATPECRASFIISDQRDERRLPGRW
jgi:hypothetical protein